MSLKELKDILERCRAVENDGFSPEDYELFLQAGRTCIEQGDGAQLLDIIKDEKNQGIVSCMGWNLLGPLVQVLLKKESESPPHCLAILMHVLEVCSPRELLIGLLEQVEDAHPDAITETIVLLLQPLQKVLLKLGMKKASSVGMALATLLNQVARLPVPYTKEQEIDDTFGLCRCCAALLVFVRPFVDEVSQGLENKAIRDGELRTELLKFCMKCLKEPLLSAQLNEDMDASEGSPLRQFAMEILGILSRIGESIPDLLFHHLLKKKEEPGFLEEDARYPMESLACLAYLLFVQHMAMDRFPAVFSPVFVLRFNVEYINTLLSRTEESRLQKGLVDQQILWWLLVTAVTPGEVLHCYWQFLLPQDLYEKTLVRVEDHSLPVALLDLKTFFCVSQNLVKVMTLCPIQHLRTRGLSVFQLSIDKFDAEAKYKFFRCMLKTSRHAGVEGYIIKNVKNQIDFALKSGNGNPWFSGSHLLPLLRLVLCLPQGLETDLLQNMDRIMESLNLLRYLLLRDREEENETGIWTELYRIEDTYLKPLRMGLNMSRSHYEMELKNLRDSKRMRVRETKDGPPSCNVTVDSQRLPDVTPEMQLQVLQSGLYMFDLIESVLCRIEEIIELKP